MTNDVSLKDDQFLNGFPSEEADPRLVRHMVHCVRNGVTSVVVRTVDSDVLILLLAFRHFADNFNSTVFCHFGSGNSACFYNSNEICCYLGEDVCHSLPFSLLFRDATQSRLSLIKENVKCGIDGLVITADRK